MLLRNLWLMMMCLASVAFGVAAEEAPPALPDGYRMVESRWYDSQSGGPMAIATKPDDPSAQGRIWFPTKGTCTSGRWGTIEAGAVHIGADRRLEIKQDTIDMVIDGRCGPATAVFEADENRLSVTRPNYPGYTFYIEVGR